MGEEESLIRHLPNNPETTDSEDSQSYQTNETLLISTSAQSRQAKHTHRIQFWVYPNRPVIPTP